MMMMMRFRCALCNFIARDGNVTLQRDNNRMTSRVEERRLYGVPPPPIDRSPVRSPYYL